MTDARFPEKLLNDRRLLKLSDVDIVSYTMATIWSVANRTDGCILSDELVLIPRFNAESAPRLVSAELWKRLGAGYVILDFDAWQTSRSELEVLDNARKRDREKKARQRAAKRDVPGDKGEGVQFSSSLSPGTEAGTAEEGQASTTAKVTDWHVAPIGEGRRAS
jgi:hypothetical protein